MKVSNLPPKGTYDWHPDEFLIRKYIFDTWRTVCIRYGFKEYMTPLIEYSNLYKAKSGIEVGGKELTVFKDRGGRELAIRPEMTPSVTRMVTTIYNKVPKPIKLFSIANFYRNQRPQKGRNKEFWQLNVDVFGSESIYTDVEIVKMSIDIMLHFGATKDDFVVLLNHRDFVKTVVHNLLKVPKKNELAAIRLLDKFWKIPRNEFFSSLKKECESEANDFEFIEKFLIRDDESIKKFLHSLLNSKIQDNGTSYLSRLSQILDDMDLEGYCIFDPTLARGLDYYTGLVFEIFPREAISQRYMQNKENDESVNRSIFGGGRYSGLSKIFGDLDISAVGFAPGDETLKIFLESKRLLPNLHHGVEIYLPVLKDVPIQRVFKLAEVLRSQQKNVLMGVEESKIPKAIEFCIKNHIQYLVILGPDELSRGVYKLKNLNTKEEEDFIFTA